MAVIGTILTDCPHCKHQTTEDSVSKTTIKDVAERAQVSIKTVSRVLNNEASVQDQTRERVLQAIMALGYRPDPAARSLRSAQSHAIGVVYDNPNAYYVIGIQHGALDACRVHGYGLQILPCDSTSPNLAAELLAELQQSRLAGLVLAPPMSERTELLQVLADNGVEFVRIISAASDPDDGLPCVFLDDRDAAYAVTEHLIQLGHQRIGFLWGGRSHRSSSERYQGYADALREYGIELNPDLVVDGDYAFDDGFRGARKLLALETRPTAIFGSNDEIAAGVLAAAKSLGMHVPYDLSIAGFEDSPFSKQSWPPLTTAKQATEDMARYATELLITRLRGGDGNGRPPMANRGFSPQLVVRGSTSPLRPEPGN